MNREQAALMTAQQFINVKDIRDRSLYTLSLIHISFFMYDGIG